MKKSNLEVFMKVNQRQPRRLTTIVYFQEKVEVNFIEV